MLFPIKDAVILRLPKPLTFNGLLPGAIKEGNLPIRQSFSGLTQAHRMSRFAKKDKETKCFEKIQRMIDPFEVEPNTRQSLLLPKSSLSQQTSASESRVVFVPNSKKMKRYRQYLQINYKPISRFYPVASSRNEEFWYIIVAVALVGMGKQHLVAMLWVHLAEEYVEELKQAAKVKEGEAEEGADEREPLTIEDLIWKAKRLREGILKCSVLVGFPRAINALLGLYQIQAQSPFDPDLTALQPPLRPEIIKPPQSTSLNASYKRGLAFFKKLHTPEIAHEILDRMETSHCSADLRNLAISRIYGEILSESSIISEKETGLLAMASCLASAIINTKEIELGLNIQVKDHMDGARNLGATGEEIRGVVRLVSATHRALKGRAAKIENDLERYLKSETEGYVAWLPKEWGENMNKVLAMAGEWDISVIHGTPKYKSKRKKH